MSDLLQTQSERKQVGKSNMSSDVAGTSSDHSLSQDLNSKFQKWRSWWSNKTHNGCIASPEFSDEESLYDVDNSIIMKARCRLMRIVGLLDDVFNGVQDVHLERYGPSEVEDSSRSIRLRMRDRFPELGSQQWELMLLMNSVDMMYRKVEAIRSLCTSYKVRMGMQVQRRTNEDNRCIIETRIENMDSNNDLKSTKTHVEENAAAAKYTFVRGFTCILAMFCSAFCFIIGTIIQKTTTTACPSKVQSTSEDIASGLVNEAFKRRRNDKGLKDNATTDSWMLITVTSYPRNGIVQRCVNLETFLRRDLPTIQVKRITSATSDKTKVTIRALKARYRQTIEYFGEIGSCAYIDRLLRVINKDLFEAQKGLDGLHDRPFKHSRPYSDRQGLLRQALTRGEVTLELKQIANTSTSRRELVTKDGLTKVVLLLEARTEGMRMRYDSWRRAREIPGRRHKTIQKPTVERAARIETEMCFRQTSAGLVVRKICVTKKRSLVERAFGGPIMNGLNMAPSLNT